MTGETPNPYEGWLDDFDRQVDDVMSPSIRPAHSAARKAIIEFNDWWQEEVPLEIEPEFSLEAQQVSKELDISLKEIQRLKEQIKDMTAVPAKRERVILQERVSELKKEKETFDKECEHLKEEYRTQAAASGNEILELRARNSRLERDFADAEIQHSRQRDGFESRVARMEERASHLESQLKDSQDGKVFVGAEYERAKRRLEDTEIQLAAERSEKVRLQSELHEKVRRLDELERESARGASQRADLEATVAELREQSTALRERLLQTGGPLSKERKTDQEEIRKISQRSADLESQLADRQKESESKIRETTRYLEMKIREIHDENKEQFGLFRELLDALVRFRGDRR